MICSSIYAKDDWKKYPQAIQTALEYLKATDFTKMETGVYEIQGKDIYAQVMDVSTEKFEDRKPEVHKKYIDVQFLVTGEEKIGITPDYGKYEVAEACDERDLYFYKEVENEGYIEVRPGCYSIFYPCDVHKPQIAVSEPMMVRKVVVKVAVSLMP